MCYENPLHLAEEIAALNLLLDQRIAIGISRSSPEQARRGWEAFGYTQETDVPVLPTGMPLNSSRLSTAYPRLTSTPKGC